MENSKVLSMFSKSISSNAERRAVKDCFEASSIVLALTCLFFLLFSMPAASAVTEWKTGVKAIMSGDEYGSCMALINYMPPDVVCPRGVSSGAWVSLDCDGEYTSVASAREALDLANIAMLTGLKVSIRVDESQRVGYCVASQVILWRE